MVSVNSLAGVFGRFVWNRKTFIALLIVSPAILTAVGSFLMSRSLDREIALLTQDRDTQVETSRQLDIFSRDVQRYELDRGSLLMLLAGQASDPNLRYTMDRLFRLNAQGSMRRIVAILYPDNWQERMRRHEELLQFDYGDKAAVDELQTIESNMIADAGRALTKTQESVNGVSARIEKLTAWKINMVMVGSFLVQILTILVFFLKTNLS